MNLKTIRLSHINPLEVASDLEKMGLGNQIPNGFAKRDLKYDDGIYHTVTITDPDTGEQYEQRVYTREPQLVLVPLVLNAAGVMVSEHHQPVSGARVDIINAGERVITDPDTGESIAAGETRIDVVYPIEWETTPFRLSTQCCPTNPDMSYSLAYDEAEKIIPESSWLVAQIKKWMDIRGIAYLSADNKTTLLNKITTFLEGGITTERTYTNCYGTWVIQGEVIIHNGTRYLSGVGHYAHAGFNPSEIPWFTELPPIGVIPEWSSFNHWEFQSMPLGTAVMDNGVIYYLINQGHGFRQPSGAFGHFGWSTTQP